MTRVYFSGDSSLGGESFIAPPGTCLAAHCGSLAHGTHDPQPDSIDDIDIMGVVIAPENFYLGFTEWEGSKDTLVIKEGRLDAVFYEFKKAVRLLMKGNPNVLGLLWVDEKYNAPVLHCNQFGHALRCNRQLFVGKHVYHTFVGYASGQLSKMTACDVGAVKLYLAATAEAAMREAEVGKTSYSVDYDHPSEIDHPSEARIVKIMSDSKLQATLADFRRKGYGTGYMGDKRKRLVAQFGYDTKNAAHLVRLLRMGLEFLKDGILRVDRTGIDAHVLRDIKCGAWSLDKVKRHANELFEACAVAYRQSKLPEGPDTVAIERLAMECLREYLRAI